MRFALDASHAEGPRPMPPPRKLRALWGLGKALFIATALATIVNAAAGSVSQAIILYEAALGVGIATGPLLGGWLGGISWRWPGTSACARSNGYATLCAEAATRSR